MQSDRIIHQRMLQKMRSILRIRSNALEALQKASEIRQNRQALGEKGHRKPFSSRQSLIADLLAGSALSRHPIRFHRNHRLIPPITKTEIVRRCKELREALRNLEYPGPKSGTLYDDDQAVDPSSRGLGGKVVCSLPEPCAAFWKYIVMSEPLVGIEHSTFHPRQQDQR